MTITASRILILLAVICFAVATVLIVVGSPAVPFLVPLGLTFGFASFLVP